ncbi:MAG: alpha/beta hydrolase [Microcoleus sp. SM1_3_4]|nr:alpha/beta hydrolase [Microcoleus sp. SM1_3_4]
MGLPFLKGRWMLLLAASATAVFYSSAAVAAQKVVLKYSAIRMTLPVTELKIFAETGKMSPALEMLLGSAKKDPETVRRSLNKPLKVSKSFLEQALNSQIGETILDEVSQVIRTPSGNEHRQALASALLLSAKDDDRITLLEAIENYPAEEVSVEGDKLVEAYGKLVALSEQFSGVSERLQEILNKIRLPRL